MDHASREPEQDKIFDLETLVYRAVVRSQGQKNGILNPKAFGLVVAEWFELPSVPDDQWCHEVLGKLDYLRRVGPMGTNYRLVRK